MCVCVCVCERERERECVCTTERENMFFEIFDLNALNMYLSPIEKGYGLISVK